MSRLAAEIRAESTLTGIRTLCGDSDKVAVGPGVPIAWNVRLPPAPLTLAVIALSPAIVPKVHAAVACPFDPVVAMRGFVEPLPPVTAKATDAPATARPDASVTVTTSPPGMVAPTTAVRLSPPPRRDARAAARRRRRVAVAGQRNRAARSTPASEHHCTINEFIGWTASDSRAFRQTAA
jgi:hypothetical protein